ncbi:DUF6402 family protein [Cupriavidus basilensis]|uniref:DUF6402 family protein n=1 Tax=Cupriavidus basilensis TaxID=68895 RepID=UPI0020A6D7FB|nr:DUF6402 family protein [Cupriavidus basilensis]MCP3021747.1 DUF6402 family protein [Cupriavidus basilensis]
MSDSEQRLTYYKPAWLNLMWGELAGDKGCTKLDVEAFMLSTAKPPPPLRDQPLLFPKPLPIKREAKSIIEGFTEFREWLNTPPPPKPAPAPKVAEKPKPKPKVKPFDIQDIPGAMDKLGWKYSAKIMRKWFAGEMNYSTNDEDDRKAINQHGQAYPPSMVDTTTFTLDWILSYQRAKEKYDELASYEKLTTPAAWNKLIEVLRRFPNMRYSRDERYRGAAPYFLHPWKLVGEDMRRFHENFQFQFVMVGSSWQEILAKGIQSSGITGTAFPNDLEGALANFSLYAAINKVYYARSTQTLARCEITEVAIYMRDTYTFYDRSDTKASQYLGHWNSTGMRAVPAAELAARHGADWLLRPIAGEGRLTEGNVFYPVQNKDFRKWQAEHKQGGDLLLFSNRRVIKLDRPIVLEFEI